MNYNEKLVIRRPSGSNAVPTGEMDLGSGLWRDYLDEVTNKDTSTICTTRCDAQDKPVMLQASADGMPDQHFDVLAFLMIERVINLIKVGDLCDITWEDGTVETLAVLKTARLDASVYLHRTGK